MATKEKDEGISYTHDPGTEVHDAAGRGHTATDKYVLKILMSHITYVLY